jgi:hypothetical protein
MRTADWRRSTSVRYRRSIWTRSALLDDVPFLDGKLPDLADDGRLDVDLGARLDPPGRRDERSEVLHGRLGHVDLFALRFGPGEHGGADDPTDDHDRSGGHEPLL